MPFSILSRGNALGKVMDAITTVADSMTDKRIEVAGVPIAKALYRFEA